MPRLLEYFQQRLNAATRRSPLLALQLSRHGRVLDCAALGQVRPGLGEETVQGILARKPVRVDLAQEDELYTLLDRRIRRHAELTQRESGVHCLWLGYPLLALRAGDETVLAPLLLWPARIEPDYQREGRLRIDAAKHAGGVRLNSVLHAWARKHLQVNLPEPDEAGPTLDLAEYLTRVAGCFHTPPQIDLDVSLQAVPESPSPPTPLPKGEGGNTPQLLNSAVLGYFRWSHENLLADLEALAELSEDSLPAMARAFISGSAPPIAEPPQAPPEQARWLVEEADFSQQQAVWQARQGPGLVIQGPPGTGKSQVIVNIIADALAQRRTILMVCQKQAALQVVLERLHLLELADLCLEVRDSEADRLHVFRSVRKQADQLRQSTPAPPQDEQRARVAARIEHLEAELDRYGKALHEPLAEVGLPYRDVLARIHLLGAEFPGARALPELQALLREVRADRAELLGRDCARLASLFHAARPLANPWRRRQPAVQATPQLQQDVHAAVEYLRSFDQAHCKAAAEPEPLPLAADTVAFSASLQNLRGQFEQLDPVSSVLVHAWLERLQQPEQGMQCMRQVKPLLEWFEHLNPAPPNPEWDLLAVKLPAAEWDALYRQARTYLAWEGSFWGNFLPGFHRARARLRQLRPDVADELLWGVARTLLLDYDERALRARLKTTLEHLLPDVTPATLGLEQAEFAQQAWEALQIALDMRREQQHFSQLTPLLENLGRSDAATLGRRCDQALARIPVAQTLLREIAVLENFLTEAGLEQVRALILAGRSILPWLEQLEHSAAHLRDLIALELEQQRLESPVREIFGVLAAYEQQRAQGKPVPTPPPDLDESDGRWWRALFELSLYRAWQQRYQQTFPELLQFNAQAHARKSDELRRLLEEKRDLDLAAIRAVWFEAQREVANKPWKRIFQLRGSKNGPAKRLREAVDLALPEGLLTLRPCWLVNPETASKLFPLQAGLFDLVIFDEASQCPLEQAIPAIYRGRVLVVAGDEKQLPPTSFFSARMDDEELEEENGEAADDKLDLPSSRSLSGVEAAGREEEQTASFSPSLPPRGEGTASTHQTRRMRRFTQEYLLHAENLLQAGSGGLPECFLRIHYRSRYPELVAFSNRAFYNGLLEAPPNAAQTAPAIDYHQVDGVYRTRRNRAEAEYIVELLKALWMEPEETNTSSGVKNFSFSRAKINFCTPEEGFPSIGVVTFNQPQRDLIEDLLEAACQHDPAFARRYREELRRKHGKAGFFVKNLENVQGDERDWLIFSTTFGPDPQGKFVRRFGPLGSSGGERRLNVAVTRAKQRVIVVSGMPVAEVADTLHTRDAAEIPPAGYLQLYLAYAQAVATQDSKQVRRIFEQLRGGHGPNNDGTALSPLAHAVEAGLERHGYKVDSQLGDSGFRIDLGVRRSDAPGYLLGIDCDGAPYFRERSARTRDVWRNVVLERWGWCLYRVWSEDWWANPEQELARLVGRVKTREALLQRPVNS